MDTFLRSHSEDGSQLPHASFSASPIVITLVASAFATAVLLITYRVIVKKCCFPGHARQDDDSFIALSPATWNVDHGLEGSVIRGIPTFRFRAVEAELRTGFCCCAVCLNEFREQDELRFLPNCSHSFHLDCIDIWLRSNANCPLCRTSISAGTGRYPDDRIIAPSSSPQDTEACSDSLLGGDENFVVIELRGSDSDVTPTYSKEQNQGKFKNSKRDKGSSMGDECIDLRDHNDHLCVQPLRRSFSLDSAADRRLFLTVQAAVGKNKNQCEEVSSGEGCSSSSKVRRSLFSFSNSRGSRNAIRPLNFEI